MAEKKQTPEEKLLRLIENPTHDTKEIKPLKKGLSFSLSWIKKLSLLKVKDKFKLSLFNLKTLNKAIAVISLVMIIYLVFDFVKGRPNLDQIYASSALGHRQEMRPSSGSQMLNLSEYLSQIDKRDIFHFTPLKEKEHIATAKEILISLSGNLKLVGIIWGKFPQAMIEDKQENKTLLLNQGDTIGKIKIKQILRDRVIINYEDQEAELM